MPTNSYLNKLKVYSDMTIPERAAFLQKNKDVLGNRYGYKVDVNGNKHLNFEYFSDDKQLKILNNLSRNQSFVNTYGREKFESMDKAQRNKFMEDDLADKALKQKFGKDPNYEYYNSVLSTKGKKELVTSEYIPEDLIGKWYSGKQKLADESIAGKAEKAINIAPGLLNQFVPGPHKQARDEYREIEEQQQRILSEIQKKDRDRKLKASKPVIDRIQNNFYEGLRTGTITAKDIDKMWKEYVGSNRYAQAYSETLRESGHPMFNFNNKQGLSHRIKMLSNFIGLAETMGGAHAADYIDGALQKTVYAVQGPDGRLWNTTKQIFTGTVAAIMKVATGTHNLYKLVTEGKKGLTEQLKKEYDPSKDSIWEAAVNDKYWDNVDKYGSFDANDHIRADKLGGLSENVNQYDLTQSGNIFSEETFHNVLGMSKFILSQGIMNYASGGTASVLGKIPGTIGKIASAAASTAGTLAGAVSIGSSYATGVFEETRQTLMDNLNKRIADKTFKDATEYQKSPEFEAAVEAETLRRAQQENVDNESIEDLRKQVRLDLLNQFRESKSQEYLNSDDIKQDMEAIDKAATDAYITSITLETIKYLPYKVTAQQWLMSPKQRALWEKTFGNTPKKLRYDDQGNFIRTGNEKGLVSKWDKVRDIGTPVVRNALYSGWTNYTDETASGFAMGLGLQNYNDYVKSKLSPDEYYNSLDPYYGVLGSVYTPGTEAYKRSTQKQALHAFIVGAGGSIIGPAFTSPKERAEAKKLASKGSRLKWNAWDKLGNFIVLPSPLLKQIAQKRTKYRREDAKEAAINAVLGKFRKDFDKDLQQVVLLGKLEKAIAEGKPESGIAKEAQALYSLASQIVSAQDSREISNSPVMQGIMERIDALAESPESIPDEEVSKALNPTAYSKEDQENIVDNLESDNEQISQEQKQQYKQDINRRAKELQQHISSIRQLKKDIDNQIGGRLETKSDKDNVIDDIASTIFQRDYLRNELQKLNDNITQKENSEIDSSDENMVASTGTLDNALNRQKGIEKYLEVLNKQLSDTEEMDRNLDKDPEINKRKSDARALKRFIRTMMYESQKERLKRLIKIANRDKSKVDSYIKSLQDGVPVEVISAKQIADLNPIDRWTLLDESNRDNYSSEQIDEIEKFIDQETTRDINYLQKVETAASLAKMVRDNSEAIKTMKTHPDWVKNYHDLVTEVRNSVLEEASYQERLDNQYKIIANKSIEEVVSHIKSIGSLRMLDDIIKWANSTETPPVWRDQIQEYVPQIRDVIKERDRISQVLTDGVQDEETFIEVDDSVPLNKYEKFTINRILSILARDSKGAVDYRNKFSDIQNYLTTIKDVVNNYNQALENSSEGIVERVNENNVKSALVRLRDLYATYVLKKQTQVPLKTEEKQVEETTSPQDVQEQTSGQVMPNFALQNNSVYDPLVQKFANASTVNIIPAIQEIINVLNKSEYSDSIKQEVLDKLNSIADIRYANSDELIASINRIAEQYKDDTDSQQLALLSKIIMSITPGVSFRSTVPEQHSPVVPNNDSSSEIVNTLDLVRLVNSTPNGVLTDLAKKILNTIKNYSPEYLLNKQIFLVYDKAATEELKKEMEENGEVFEFTKHAVITAAIPSTTGEPVSGITSSRVEYIGILPFGNDTGNIYNVIRENTLKQTPTNNVVVKGIKGIRGNMTTLKKTYPDAGKKSIDNNSVKSLLQKLPHWGDLTTAIKQFAKHLFIGTLKGFSRASILYDYTPGNSKGPKSIVTVKDMKSTISNGRTLLEYLHNGGQFSEFNNVTSSALKYFIKGMNAIPLNSQEKVKEFITEKIIGKEPGNSYFFNLSDASGSSIEVDYYPDTNTLKFNLNTSGKEYNIASINLSEYQNNKDEVLKNCFNDLIKNIILDFDGNVRQFIYHRPDNTEVKSDLLKWQAPYEIAKSKDQISENILTNLIQGEILQVNTSDLELKENSYIEIPITTQNSTITTNPPIQNSANNSLELSTQKPDVDETLNQKLQRMKNFSETVNLTEDEEYYTDGQAKTDGKPNLFVRVTRLIKDKIKEVTNMLKVSQALGNHIDSLYRRLSSGEMIPLNIMEEAARTTDFSKVEKLISDNISTWEKDFSNVNKDSLKDIIKRASYIIGVELMQGRHLLGFGVKVSGILNYKGEQMQIAGTLDLVSYDEDGNFYIFDMKSNRNYDISGKNNIQTQINTSSWAKQLYLYKLLLEQQYGVRVMGTKILPIKTDYRINDSASIIVDKKTQKVTIDGKDFSGDKCEVMDVLDLAEQVNRLTLDDVLTGADSAVEDYLTYDPNKQSQETLSSEPSQQSNRIQEAQNLIQSKSTIELTDLLRQHQEDGAGIVLSDDAQYIDQEAEQVASLIENELRRRESQTQQTEEPVKKRRSIPLHPPTNRFGLIESQVDHSEDGSVPLNQIPNSFQGIKMEAANGNPVMKKLVDHLIKRLGTEENAAATWNFLVNSFGENLPKKIIEECL